MKSREQADYNIIKDFCQNEGLTNVEVVVNNSIFDLVSQSKAVIALNSLATIESMLSKKPIFVPDWLIKKKEEKLFDTTDDLSRSVVDLCTKDQELMII